MKYIIIISLCFSLLTTAHEYSLLASQNEPYSHVAFLGDGNSNRFVIKQILNITDTFCGIDMGNAYKQNLCKEAVCQLLRSDSIKHQFSVEEYQAMLIYTMTLETLIKLFPPKKLHNKLIELLDQANLTNIGFDQSSYDECINFYKNMITESYHDAIALLGLLEILLSDHSGDHGKYVRF